MPTPASHQLPPPSADLIAGASLFLDFDGTLVEIAERHDAVVVDDDLRALVAALARRLEGRLAIVSGRSVDEILAYLVPPGAPPGFAIAGSHGLELMLPCGRRERPEPPETLTETIEELKQLARITPGLVIEEKPFGAALHYRQAPEAAEAVETLARTVAGRGVFTLQHGKMVWELRIAGPDKGDAVKALIAEPPMAGTRPVFVGDDLTDEAGFRAAIGLGGTAILVGERWDSAADRGLPNVPAVHAWLARIAERVAA
ncbi:MAG: haloacid dehalogenase [Sphingomonas bacterium]|nr:haloacid dehalogenase [Sphingomonas bacterium]